MQTVRHENTKRLAEELGVSADGPFEIRRDGYTVLLEYVPRTRAPPWITLTVGLDEARGHGEDAGGAYRAGGRPHVAVRPAIVLRRESGFDRLGKRLRLNREVQTGDAQFDAEVYVDTSSTDEAVQRTLSNGTLRDAVRDLLNQGVTRVELGPAGLSTLHFVADGPVTREAVAPLVDGLVRVAKALPTFERGRADKPDRPLLSVLLWAPLMVVPIVTFVILDSGTAHHPVLDGTAAAIAAGALVWVLLVLVAAAFHRGGPDSLLRVIIAALMNLWLPFLTFFFLRSANVRLDESQAVAHAATVSRLWTTTTKEGPRCWVALTSWRTGEDVVELDPPCLITNELRPGDQATVITHAGKLGWEWVAGYRVVKPGLEARYDIGPRSAVNVVRNPLLTDGPRR